MKKWMNSSYSSNRPGRPIIFGEVTAMNIDPGALCRIQTNVKVSCLARARWRSSGPGVSPARSQYRYQSIEPQEAGPPRPLVRHPLWCPPGKEQKGYCGILTSGCRTHTTLTHISCIHRVSTRQKHKTAHYSNSISQKYTQDLYTQLQHLLQQQKYIYTGSLYTAPAPSSTTNVNNTSSISLYRSKCNIKITPKNTIKN